MRIGGYRLSVGFNPFRESDKTALDIVLVVATVVVTLGAVAWALFGT